MKEYLAKLNEKQYNACVDVEGPSLIIAGAGSGKTRVLTNRIAYMINDCGIAPYNILAITFTNKAAKEMNDRLSLQIGDDAKFVTCKTFHSFSAYLLRREIEVLNGRKRNFQIIDDDETEGLIRESMNELQIDPKMNKPKSYATYISLIKSNISTIDSYDKFTSEKIEKIMNKYEEKLIANNLLDFDDLLRLVIEVFKKDPSILDKYQERYKYILVDEFQDSSNIQYEFVSMLGEKYSNVFIVGDEDQSIYSFRGANIGNIKKFMKEFKGYHEHILDQNYRSAPEILEISNKLIANNENRIKKSLWTDRKRGDGVKLHKFENDKLEARFVSSTILREVQKGAYKFKDFAILYRNNYLSRNFENDLIEHKIPYRVYSGLSFYKRKEVKDMLGYLRIVLDKNDFYSFQRVIKTPSRGIGDTSLKKIGTIFENNGGDLMKAVEDAKISQSAKDEIGLFMITIDSLKKELTEPDKKLKDFVMDVYKKTGYKACIDEIEDDDEKETRTENIMELFTAITEAEVIGNLEETLSEFLNNVSLLTDQDLEGADDNCVALITMHSAKGLEYPNVFAVALEDDTIPGARAVENGDVEEERRLLYVCLTRAKDNLYISSCKDRFKFGTHIISRPSRFIKELGLTSIEENEMNKPLKTVVTVKKQAVVGDMKPGDRVSHSIHGEGTIKAQVEGFYIVKFDKKPSPMKIIVNHPLLKKIS